MISVSVTDDIICKVTKYSSRNFHLTPTEGWPPQRYSTFIYWDSYLFSQKKSSNSIILLRISICLLHKLYLSSPSTLDLRLWVWTHVRMSLVHCHPAPQRAFRLSTCNYAGRLIKLSASEIRSMSLRINGPLSCPAYLTLRGHHSK